MPSSISTKKATIGEARRVSAILKQHPLVDQVLLFGSVAREGKGNDVDLIVLTNQERARRFISLMNGRLFPTCYGIGRTCTRKALDTMDMNFFMLFFQAEEIIGPDRIDLFVFEANWRERLAYLQHALPHDGPMFMQNVARDALRIA